MSVPKEVLDRVSRYIELSEDEMYDLYDELDTLYNEVISKYLEALMFPEKNRELVNRVIELAKMLLSKEERSIEEDLMLIALLDIFATDLHNKTAGFMPIESGEK